MSIREKAKKLDKILSTLEKHYSRSVLPEEGRERLENFIFYLLFYANPVTNARKAIKTFTDETLYADWNEVRVSTLRELEDILRDARIEEAPALAAKIKNFFQKVFEELDDTALEPLSQLKVEKAKKFVGLLEGIPSWAQSYLLVQAELDSNVPFDPHTERVAGRLGLFDPKKDNLAQRKKLLRAALQDDNALTLHHLFVEHGKKTCVEEDPKCTKCPVNKDCDFFTKKGRSPKADVAPLVKAKKNGASSTEGNGTKKPKAPKAPKKK